jgi:hypothetical protein
MMREGESEDDDMIVALIISTGALRDAELVMRKRFVCHQRDDVGRGELATEAFRRGIGVVFSLGNPFGYIGKSSALLPSESRLEDLQSRSPSSLNGRANDSLRGGRGP